MVVIGLLGKKSAGKDTLADNFPQLTKLSFAQPLGQMCMQMFMMTKEQLTDPVLKETPDPRWFGASPRKIMQFVGTELFRNQLNEIMPGIDQNVFVHRFKMRANETQGDIIVSDVRFQNEADAIHELGGIVIKLVRTSKNTDTHISEMEIEKIENYDYLIENVEGDKQSMFDQFWRIYISHSKKIKETSA
jgi:hypothetical protein